MNGKRSPEGSHSGRPPRDPASRNRTVRGGVLSAGWSPSRSARELYVNGGKRVFDVVASSLLLVVLAPLQIGVGVLIRASLGGPVFFRQERPGLDGKPFTLVKFRTMSCVTDENGQPLPDELRVGRLGSFLRSSSVDELPELWNVLRGEMSLVGPRPLLTKYLPRYSAVQSRRHDVRPGMTGWAQVHGRNLPSWEEKLGMDVWYADHVSASLDLQILLATVRTIVSRVGVRAQGHVTAPEFMGSDVEKL